MIQLISHELPQAELEALAQLCGWSTQPSPVQVIAVREIGPFSITSCLASPFVGAIETMDDEAECRPGHHFLRHLALGGLGLRLTTASAYQCEAAHKFALALTAQRPHWIDQAPEMERAVHEMVANALVHGNLEVRSPRPGMAGFDAYCKALDEALADPARRRRRLELSAALVDGMVGVAITDQGPGYTFCRIIEPGDEPQPREHGLAIASSMANLVVEDGGRCSLLRFPVGARP